MRALTAFNAYREMLGDSVRMQAYQHAIAAVVRPGDTVIDLGSGTGILGFLALEAGAKQVHLIEKSDAIELSRAVARHNGWTDRVVFHSQSSFEVKLDQRADVLVSETLGSFGVDENTVPTTLDARDRLLVAGAPMVPQSIELWLAPSDSDRVHQEREVFWRDVAGIDFTPAADLLREKLGIVEVSAADLMANPHRVAHLDLRTLSSTALSVQQRFVFHRPGRVRGLVGWFRAHLGHGVGIDTGPGNAATHWKQAWLPFRESVEVGCTDILDLTLAIHSSPGAIDDTTLHWDWFCSQIDLSPTARQNLPCPCGSGNKAKRCCAIARPWLPYASEHEWS